MKFLALPILAAFTSTSIAATAPTTQPKQPVQQAQDSTNGSMTETNLSGNLDQDTSQLNSGSTSDTTHGAIIDQSSKRKKKTKKKHSTQESTTTETESGSTSDARPSDESGSREK